MMRAMQLSELAAPLGANLCGDDLSFASVSTDTRSLRGGDLFVALRGDNFDGHRYLEQARQAGAVARHHGRVRAVDDFKLAFIRDGPEGRRIRALELFEDFVLVRHRVRLFVLRRLALS